MLEDRRISAMIPRSWEKSFNNGIVILVKMKRCNQCKGKILCDEFKNQVIKNKNFEAILKILERDIRNQFGHMPLFYKL